MPPFRIHFRPSKLRRICLILFASALLLCILAYFSGSLKIGLILATLATTAYAWHEPVPRIIALNVDTQGRAQLMFSQIAYDAQLLSGSLIHPYLCCLKWQLPEKIIYQWIWLDSTDSEGLRRLCVWAKFGLTKK